MEVQTVVAHTGDKATMGDYCNDISDNYSGALYSQSMTNNMKYLNNDTSFWIMTPDMYEFVIYWDPDASCL